MQKSVKTSATPGCSWISGKWLITLKGWWRLYSGGRANHTSPALFYPLGFQAMCIIHLKSCEMCPKMATMMINHWIISDHCIDWHPIFRKSNMCIWAMKPYLADPPAHPRRGKTRTVSQEANRPRRGRCNCAHHEMMRKSFTWRWLASDPVCISITPRVPQFTKIVSSKLVWK